MKSIPAFVVAICIAHVSNAGGFVPPDGPKPILTFTQTEPWALVIGADIPRVAVYENREVIFAKRVGKKLVYHHATLDNTAFDRLQELMKPILNFDQLDTSYDVRGGWTDQPEARFYLRDGKRERVTCVYGLVCGAEQETPARSRIPRKSHRPKRYLRYTKGSAASMSPTARNGRRSTSK